MDAAAALVVDIAYRRGDLALEVAFAAGPGFTALVGPSGVGKSTTLALIAGLLRPSRGVIRCGDQVFFDGQRSVPPEQRRVGLVFQSLALFPHLDVLGNVAYGARGAVTPAEWLARCEVGRLARRRPATLSGGEAQRVALARALAMEPRVLLLDEPFSALDADLRHGLRETVRRLVGEAGIPTVLVTHDAADAAALATQTIRLPDRPR